MTARPSKQTIKAALFHLETAAELIEQLPSGIDKDADEMDKSPSDMVAHIGGLVYRQIVKAIDTLAE